ncbi:MAG: hypothetical protein IKQ10_11160 [Oscillospiraceae bacterium]|nr:hypothetical protein [Oscillospiraceae bacterium]
MEQNRSTPVTEKSASPRTRTDNRTNAPTKSPENEVGTGFVRKCNYGLSFCALSGYNTGKEHADAAA